MIQRKGTILIIALWIMAILSLLALGLGHRMGLELRLAGYQRDRLKLLYIARAGINRTILELEKTESSSYHSLKDLSRITDSLNNTEVGDGQFLLEISDEERKININRASEEILTLLPGISKNIASSIIDWRDEDNDPLTGGAESQYYLSLDPPYECKNSAFELKEELLLVKGIDAETLSQFRDLITTYGEGRVNINTASRDAFEALGLDEDLIDSIIYYRRGADAEVSYRRSERYHEYRLRI